MRLSPHLPDNTCSFTFVFLAAFFVAIVFQIGIGVLTRLTKRPKAKGVNNGCVPGCDGDGQKRWMIYRYPMWMDAADAYVGTQKSEDSLLVAHAIVPAFKQSPPRLRKSNILKASQLMQCCQLQMHEMPMG